MTEYMWLMGLIISLIPYIGNINLTNRKGKQSMSKLKWDQIGERLYETGVDHGVLYPQKDGAYPEGVAWNGLTNITESPSGAEDNPLYADNMKYLNLKSAEEFGATVECYTYPKEWAACNGESELAAGVTLGQQRRNTFGLSYRTKIGNDTDGEDHGFKIHLVYGCSAAPSEKAYSTVNDSPEAITFSYEVTTTPVNVSGKDASGKPFKPVSCVTIDSTLVSAEAMERLEAILYGQDAVEGETPVAATPARLPLPDELKEIFAEG